MAQVEPTTSKWLATFDDLTALPKARQAVFVYLLLSVMVFVGAVALALSGYRLALTYWPSLDADLSFNLFGLGLNADFGGLITTALFIMLWLQAMNVVRSIAVWAGGTTKEVPQ
ncbi:hypothetical protein [Aquidulcibacter sp.]|uniref:hypothetical protein n=1 Tax=Aquidulcibacter sp. TaxID=2052990 RepID=UPI0025B86CAC|nr:hypothetical protein [Aquidulcibacter sp.]MCA3697206.1 hypothetical protein [Aquidulcibacter sp.]